MKYCLLVVLPEDCRVASEEDSLRAIEDVDAWSSHLPEEFHDAVISSMVTGVKKHRFFKDFMAHKISSGVFSSDYTFGASEPRADLDEWFDFLRPVIANLAVPGEAPGGPDLHEDVEEEKSGSEREGQDSCEGEGEGGCRMTMNLNDNDNGDLIKT